MRSARLVLVAVAFLGSLSLSTGSGLASDEFPEKIFVLKNGFRIRGFLRSQTDEQIVVKTEKGKLFFPRGDILRMEDPPPPSTFLMLPKKKPATASDIAVVASPMPAVVSSETPAAVASVVPVVAHAPKKRLVATREEIDAARATLLTLPPPVGDEMIDLADRERKIEERQKAIDEVKGTIPLPALVGIMADPVSDAASLVAKDLAKQIIEGAGKAAIPALAAAIAELDLTKPIPGQLLQTAGALGDDASGSIETALDEKLKDGVRAEVSPVVLLPLLSKIATRRSIPLLENLIVFPSDFDLTLSYEDVCRTVLDKEPDPEPLVAPLLKLVDPDQLPAANRLRTVLSLLSYSKSAARVVAKVLDSLERGALEPDETGARAACFLAAFRSLAKMATPDARLALLEELAITRDEARRLEVYTAIGAEGKLEKSVENEDFLCRIVDRMGTIGLSKGELDAMSDTLLALTGERLGTDPAKWREYLDKRAR